MEDWAEIRRLHFSERMSIKAIERLDRWSRNTIRSAVRSMKPPKYERAGTGSVVDAVEALIRKLLQETPTMPATVIAERIGWEHGMTVLKERVRELRPLYAPADPSSRTTYKPGEIAQCDLWFPDADIPLGFGQVGRGKTAPPVLVLTAGYSSFRAARMIPTRHAEDLALGVWAVTQQLGAVPKCYVWDNEGGVGRYGGGNPRLTREFQILRGLLGTRIYVCKPRDPEAKGKVERTNGYFETSFLPGRRFSSPQDFNVQIAEFLVRGNAQKRPSLGGASANDRVGADRAAMGPLPPIEVVSISWRNSLILPRDHWVRLDTCDYSVHPSAIGQRVEVVADLGRVRVRRGGVLVGEHERCWARHQTITDDEHREAADIMRQAFQGRTPAQPGPADADVQQRKLADYDQILGTGGDDADEMGQVA